VGTRILSAFRKISLQMELQANETAEYAHLVGADTLHDALKAWASEWADHAGALKMKKTSLYAEAYMADVGASTLRYQFS